jgi:hypothetical protein
VLRRALSRPDAAPTQEGRETIDPPGAAYRARTGADTIVRKGCFVVAVQGTSRFAAESSGRYRREDLACWLDLELDLSFVRSEPGEPQAYRDAIAQAAMSVLREFLTNPENRELPRQLDSHCATLYRSVGTTDPVILGLHLSGLMWQTSIEAADAVVTQLAAGGYESSPQPSRLTSSGGVGPGSRCGPLVWW